MAGAVKWSPEYVLVAPLPHVTTVTICFDIVPKAGGGKILIDLGALYKSFAVEVLIPRDDDRRTFKELTRAAYNKFMVGERIRADKVTGEPVLVPCRLRKPRGGGGGGGPAALDQATEAGADAQPDHDDHDDHDDIDDQVTNDAVAMANRLSAASQVASMHAAFPHSLTIEAILPEVGKLTPVSIKIASAGSIQCTGVRGANDGEVVWQFLQRVFVAFVGDFGWRSNNMRLCMTNMATWMRCDRWDNAGPDALRPMFNGSFSLHISNMCDDLQNRQCVQELMDPNVRQVFYEPERHAACNIIYRSRCLRHAREDILFDVATPECGCKLVTIMVFTTGSVLVYGATHQRQAMEAWSWFLVYLNLQGGALVLTSQRRPINALLYAKEQEDLRIAAAKAAEEAKRRRILEETPSQPGPVGAAALTWVPNAAAATGGGKSLMDTWRMSATAGRRSAAK